MHACMPSCFSHVQFFAPLCTIAHQAPLFKGFSWREYWSGFPCLPPGDFPNPGTEPMSPASPALQVDSLSTEPPGKPHMPLKGANNGTYCPVATKLNRI